MDTPARKTYEFRVYEQLGELYIKQERPKDAADTFNQFARKNPLHAQAPVMQARVIEIYERTGFTNQAIEAQQGIRRALRPQQRVPRASTRMAGTRRSRWSRRA